MTLGRIISTTPKKVRVCYTLPYSSNHYSSHLTNQVVIIDEESAKHFENKDQLDDAYGIYSLGCLMLFDGEEN